MQTKLNPSVTQHHLFLPGYLQSYLDMFIKELYEKGYTELTINTYYISIAHFGSWLQKENISLREINNATVNSFEKHHCCCLVARRINKMSLRYARRVKHFILYLTKQGIIKADHRANKKKILPSKEI